MLCQPSSICTAVTISHVSITKDPRTCSFRRPRTTTTRQVDAQTHRRTRLPSPRASLHIMQPCSPPALNMFWDTWTVRRNPSERIACLKHVLVHINRQTATRASGQRGRGIAEFCKSLFATRNAWMGFQVFSDLVYLAQIMRMCRGMGGRRK